MVRILPDGTYLTALIDPKIRNARRREMILAAARSGQDLTDVEDAVDDKGHLVVNLVRVVEYDVPDRDGNGSGELIVLLSTVPTCTTPMPTSSPRRITNAGNRKSVMTS
jgi:hypothetical protein